MHEKEKFEIVYAQNRADIKKIVTESFLIYLKTNEENKKAKFKAQINKPSAD